MEEINPPIIAGLLLVLTGVFLTADALYLHLLTFNYVALNLGWLDSYISHGLWGVLFVVLGTATALYRQGAASR